MSLIIINMTSNNPASSAGFFIMWGTIEDSNYFIDEKSLSACFCSDLIDQISASKIVLQIKNADKIN